MDGPCGEDREDLRRVKGGATFRQIVLGMEFLMNMWRAMQEFCFPLLTISELSFLVSTMIVIWATVCFHDTTTTSGKTGFKTGIGTRLYGTAQFIEKLCSLLRKLQELCTLYFTDNFKNNKINYKLVTTKGLNALRLIMPMMRLTPQSSSRSSHTLLGASNGPD